MYDEIVNSNKLNYKKHKCFITPRQNRIVEEQLELGHGTEKEMKYVLYEKDKRHRITS